MTAIEYCETKRLGIVHIINKLQAYYKENNDSFANLNMECLYHMAREIDTDSKNKYSCYTYESCLKCDKYRDMFMYQTALERKQNNEN